MENVLVKVNEIEKVIQKEDACLVVMESGKTWVCENTIDGNTQKLLDYIDENQGNSLIRLPLKKGGEQK
jgi:hypothetical protein